MVHKNEDRRINHPIVLGGTKIQRVRPRVAASLATAVHVINPHDKTRNPNRPKLWWTKMRAVGAIDRTSRVAQKSDVSLHVSVGDWPARSTSSPAGQSFVSLSFYKVGVVSSNREISRGPS